VQDTRLRRQPGEATDAARRSGLRPDSLAWLFAVPVLFLLSQLVLPSLLHLPLGADEITYIARTSIKPSGVFLPPVHGHAVGLLAAPVTLITSSLVALRIWMALLSSVSLLLALLAWRGLRPAWLLALAGFIFVSLAITQLSGVQVYPDLWAAFGTLAITGLLLQSASGRMRPRVVLPLIAFAAFFIVLLRPQNIAFVLAPTLIAAVAVRRWRKPGVLVAMGAGMALGLLEWVAEAYLWFGGPGNRLHLAGQEPPRLALHFSVLTQARVLSGPWYCNTTRLCAGMNFPVLIFWWLALLGLVAVGLYVGWRTERRASAVLAVLTGVWVAGLYVLFVPFGAPRYLLPTWALFMIVAADGIAWLATVPRWRRIAAALVCAFLLVGAVSQHLVLNREIVNSATIRNVFIFNASQLRRLGVKPPCVVEEPSAAYYLGCWAPWSSLLRPARTIGEVLKLTPGGPSGWQKVLVPTQPRASYVWVKR
jgi:hypothetical protein